MMRSNIDTTRTARVCQIASLLLIPMLVLGMLAHDIYRNAEMADAGSAGAARAARLVIAP